MARQETMPLYRSVLDPLLLGFESVDIDFLGILKRMGEEYESNSSLTVFSSRYIYNINIYS